MLLAQWVSSSRCMGGCGAVGSDARPHVHLDAVLPGQPERSQCGCKRQRQDNTPAAGGALAPPAATAERTHPSEQGLPGDDHGVLFLSFDVGVALRAVPGSDGVQPAPDQLIGRGEAWFALCRDRERRDPQSFLYPVPVSSLPVYLLTLCLRI